MLDKLIIYIVLTVFGLVFLGILIEAAIYVYGFILAFIDVSFYPDFGD